MIYIVHRCHREPGLLSIHWSTVHLQLDAPELRALLIQVFLPIILSPTGLQFSPLHQQQQRTPTFFSYSSTGTSLVVSLWSAR